MRRLCQSLRQTSVVRPALVLSFALLAAGCVTAPPLDMGSPPRVSGLKQLKSQESSVTEVVSALGTPRGYGMMRHTPDQPVRPVLVYEYVQMKGEQIGMNVLLVYLDDGKYDGHLWFSARELMTVGLQ
ncbi:MAG: hypothetical protein QNJ94_18075 [Alphaproteobacteria bacterium]|nr:hypothetical protein [Alphaproteobacteria bacterium]